MIACCTCNCGSTEQLIRGFLEKSGYKEWLSIPVPRGKEKSLYMLQSLPWCSEIEMLENYIKDASKWVVIIGWNENGCRWADIAHNANKSNIEAKFIIDTFAN